MFAGGLWYDSGEVVGFVCTCRLRPCVFVVIWFAVLCGGLIWLFAMFIATCVVVVCCFVGVLLDFAV